jgi:flagellar biosynthesis protein FlhF
MEVKTFKAPSMRQALDLVKRELGREAVILHTKTLTEGGFLGFGGHDVVEITASRDVNIVDDVPTTPYVRRQYDNAVRAARDVTTRRNELVAKEQTATIVEDIREVKTLIELLSSDIAEAGFPPRLSKYYLRLVERGVERTLAQQLLRAVYDRADKPVLEDETRITELLCAEIEQRVETTGAIRKSPRRKKAHVVGLVGPTGVGKTTSIAKLASNYSMTERKRVALITADTYRIAATEQLKIYADIMRLPLDVVFSPADMKKAISKRASADYIFIDTAGGSQFNEEYLRELKNYMDAARPDETHLVLSATTQLDDLLTVIERFEILQPTCYLFSKLDETLRHGAILTAPDRVKQPLSYFSTGQSVPDDIELATAQKISGLLTEERD